MSEQQQATTSPRRRVRGSKAAIAVAVVLAAAALTVAATRGSASAASSTPACAGSTPRLTVQGTGQASGRPDSLDFDAQVSVNASSAASALAQDSTTTSSVVQAIEAAGVKSRDIQTTDLTINPNYTFTKGNSIITGYGVTNSLAVTVRRLADAGAAIDAATTAGGNALSVGSLTFAQSDPRTLEDQARRDAVRQAVTHAGAMARAAGQGLGVVCSLTDQSSLSQGVATPEQFGPLNASAASVPLEGGTQQASAQVTLVYELEPLRH
jgi:uncharacterized protein YggE